MLSIARELDLTRKCPRGPGDGSWETGSRQTRRKVPWVDPGAAKQLARINVGS